MRKFVLNVLVTCGVATMSPAAVAQIGAVLKQTGLVNSDFAIMKDAAAELYSAEQPVVGSETIWQNPETGAYGMVELTAHDGHCAEFTHLFTARGRKPDVIKSRRCRNDSGEWLLNLEGQED